MSVGSAAYSCLSYSSDSLDTFAFGESTTHPNFCCLKTGPSFHSLVNVKSVQKTIQVLERMKSSYKKMDKAAKKGESNEKAMFRLEKHISKKQIYVNKTFDCFITPKAIGSIIRDATNGRPFLTENFEYVKVGSEHEQLFFVVSLASTNITTQCQYLKQSITLLSKLGKMEILQIISKQTKQNYSNCPDFFNNINYYALPRNVFTLLLSYVTKRYPVALYYSTPQEFMSHQNISLTNPLIEKEWQEKFDRLS